MPHGDARTRAYIRAVLARRAASLALLAFSAFLAPLLGTPRARACATCGAGDTARQIAGAEQPFRGRVRLAAVAVHTSYGDDDAQIWDQRLVLGASVAIEDVALLSAALPLAWRETLDASLARDTSLGIGDLDLRVRVVVLRDRAFAPAHRLLLELGSRLPTAPLLCRADGTRAPLASQLGTGAFEPLLGLAWLSVIDDTSLSLSIQGAFPMTGFEGWRNGAALRTALAAQWQPLLELAVRASLDARLEAPSGLEAQRPSGETFLLHAGGGVVVAPTSDLVLHVIVRVPVLGLHDSTHGARWDGVTVEGGFALDV